MGLPFSFSKFFKKEQSKEYFLALLLQDEVISAVVLEETDQKLHVVGHAQEFFSTSLEEAHFEELLETLDKAISTAESTLPKGIQTHKTILGVKNDWVVEGKITKDHLTILKRACEELDLTPIGFLVFTEAIIHSLQKEEGAPVSAILVETGKKFITISLVRAGRIVETRKVTFALPITTTVDTALKSFDSVEILPARIILFASSDTKKLSQSFISYSWSNSLPFLHVPQVTILPQGFDTKAILQGTATQMGFEVSTTHTLPLVLTNQKTTKEMQKEEAPIENMMDNFAFVKDQGEQKQEEKQHTESISETLAPDYFGFMENIDVVHTSHGVKTMQSESVPDDVLNTEIQEIPEIVKEEETFETKPNSLPTQGSLLATGIKEGLSRIQSLFKFSSGMSLPSMKGRKLPGKGFLIIPAVIGMFLLLLLLYIFGSKATVTLFISPKVLQQNVPVTFVQDGTTDPSKNSIGAKGVTTDEKGSVSVAATGTKNVGTPAKGTITIFSRLSDTTNLSKGTTITASNGLTFTLDTSVTIASFSGGANDSSITVSNVAITASDIGKDYNLPSGTIFTLSGVSKSDVSAKNDNPFSGGTKNTLTVVAQKDLDSLGTTLTKNLEQKAQDDLQKNSSGKVLLPGFVSETLSQKTYSNKVGDQANNVSLDGTVSYMSLAYDLADITTFAKSVLQNQIAANPSLKTDKVETAVSDLKSKDTNTFTATLQVKAVLIPQIDTASLAGQIAGRSVASATTIFKSIPESQDVTISLSPSFSFLPKILPRIAKNIHISIVSQ